MAVLRLLADFNPEDVRLARWAKRYGFDPDKFPARLRNPESYIRGRIKRIKQAANVLYDEYSERFGAEVSGTCSLDELQEAYGDFWQTHVVRKW